MVGIGHLKDRKGLYTPLEEPSSISTVSCFSWGYGFVSKNVHGLEVLGSWEESSSFPGLEKREEG